MLRSFGGLNIDNIDRRMPGKISLEVGPSTGQDPAASIQTWDRSAEDITRKGKRCDVTRGGPSESVQIDFRSLAPDENSIVAARMRGQISSRLRRDASLSQPRPVFD